MEKDIILTGWKKETIFTKDDFEIISNKDKSSNYLLFYKKSYVSSFLTLEEANEAVELFIKLMNI